MDNIKSIFVEIISFIRRELSEYKSTLNEDQFENLVTYVSFMKLKIPNHTKEFLGIYGPGKTTLTKKILDIVRDTFYYVEKDSVSNQRSSKLPFYKDLDFLEANVVVFRGPALSLRGDIKKCTSGDLEFYTDDDYNDVRTYLLTKYVIAELDTDEGFDDSIRHRQLRIDLN